MSSHIARRWTCEQRWRGGNDGTNELRCRCRGKCRVYLESAPAHKHAWTNQAAPLLKALAQTRKATPSLTLPATVERGGPADFPLTVLLSFSGRPNRWACACGQPHASRAHVPCIRL